MKNEITWRDFLQLYNLFFKNDGINATSLETLGKFLSLCLADTFAKAFDISFKKFQTKTKRKYNNILKDIDDLSIFTPEAEARMAMRQGFATYNAKYDLKKAIKKELDKRTAINLNLIKATNEKHKALIESTFYGNVGVDGKEMAKALGIKNISKKAIRQQDNILNDQLTKFSATLDEIEAEYTGAFAFKWQTHFDSRVVGNPTGLYPKPTNPKMHGDHYHRNNKIYFMKSQYPNSWIYKQGLVNPKKVEWDEFEDGKPGMPINCRCFATYYYSLESLPSDVLDKVLTKKGKKLI